MDRAPLLRAFGATGYRSLGGQDLQYVGPMAKVHLLAGPNNAGKSNVLAIAQRLLPTLGTTSDLALKDTDRPANEAGEPSPVRLAIGYDLSVEELDAAASGRGQVAGTDLWRVLDGPTFTGDGSGLVWFEFEAEIDNPGQQTNWRTSLRQVRDADTAGNSPGNHRYRTQDLSAALTGTSGGQPFADAARVMQHLVEALGVKTKLPPIATVGAFRQITSGGATAGTSQLDGGGLIEKLARLERPSHANWSDRDRFARITNLVRTLLDDREAEIAIPHDADDVLLTHNGLTLPLENYGTGVQQIVILAAAATVLQGHLVCIEEPEVHLHPTMQRALLRYLVESTDNQYLVATHSAHLLDAGRASISAVRVVDGTTRVARAVSPVEVADISAGLGFRASDLVQSNAVIWVEGPSDRTYLRHWISFLAPELLEGVHYSLMFYGGGLLSHLSPDDPAIDEFVALPRINRNFAVVIDSDKTGPRKAINATKRRIRDSVEAAGRHTLVWVTQGYTIENYVPRDVLAAAVAAAHPGTTSTWAGDRYENPLGKDQISGARAQVDKPAVARRVIAQQATGSWNLDLRTRVEELVAMIREANAS